MGENTPQPQVTEKPIEQGIVQTDRSLAPFLSALVVMVVVIIVAFVMYLSRQPSNTSVESDIHTAVSRWYELRNVADYEPLRSVTCAATVMSSVFPHDRAALSAQLADERRTWGAVLVNYVDHMQVVQPAQATAVVHWHATKGSASERQTTAQLHFEAGQWKLCSPLTLTQG